MKTESWGTRLLKRSGRLYVLAVLALIAGVCALATLAGTLYLSHITVESPEVLKLIGKTLAVAFVLVTLVLSQAFLYRTRSLRAFLREPAASKAPRAWEEAHVLADHLLVAVFAAGLLSSALVLAVLHARFPERPWPREFPGILASFMVSGVEVALLLPMIRAAMLPVLRQLKETHPELSLSQARRKTRSLSAILIPAFVLFNLVTVVLAVTLLSLGDGVDHIGQLEPLALGVVVFAVLLMAAVTLLYLQLLLRPLNVLLEGVQSIEEGNSSWRAGVLGIGEIGQLGESFDHLMEQQEQARSLMLERERLLQRSQRLETIGTLTAGVAHEINNPAATVSANLEYLTSTIKQSRALLPPEDFDELIGALADSRSSMKRLVRITSQLRTQATDPEKEQAQTVPLEKLLQSSLDQLQPLLGSKVALELQLDPCPPVLARQEALRQVLINLITNAVQAMDEQGRGTLRLATGEEADGVFFSVEDDGPGIPEEIIDRIFDPFFTTKPVGKGTGLGLHISHQIISEEGGRLEVHRLQPGTRFTVSLPRLSAPLSNTTPNSSTDLMAIPKLDARVLLVDDDPAVRRAMDRSLRPHVQSLTTVDVHDAITLLRSDSVYDALIVDLIMPGVSGRELRDWVEVHRPELSPRFCFLTANSVDASGIREGGGRVLLKPCPPEQVLQVCEEMMGLDSPD